MNPPPLASRRHTFRLLLIVAAVAVLGSYRSQHATLLAKGSPLPLYLMTSALQLLFVWFVRKGLRAYGHSLGELLGRTWRKPFDGIRDLALAASFFIALNLLTVALYRALGITPEAPKFFLPHTGIEIGSWIVLSLLAGSCEEIVYRGYLQRQFAAILRSLPLAVIAQALVFALGHLYQGWRATGIIFLYGMAFGLLAAWRKSILPGMIAHSAIDIVSGLAAR